MTYTQFVAMVARLSASGDPVDPDGDPCPNGFEHDTGDSLDALDEIIHKARKLIGEPVPVAPPPPHGCYALSIDGDDHCSLELFPTKAERDAFMWDYAFENSGTECATLEEFKAEHDNELSDAMEATNDGYLTDDMVLAPPPAPAPKGDIVVVLDGGLVQHVCGTGDYIGLPVHIIDYDTDGTGDDELTEIDQSNGTVVEAHYHVEEIGVCAITLPEGKL